MIVHMVLVVPFLLFSKTLGLGATEEFIVGGGDARLGQFPFMVAVNRSTQEGKFFCGGAIVHPQWIITSATCVEKAISLDITIGSINLSPVGPSGAVVTTGTYIQHPKFDKISLENDIALIHTHSSIIFDDYKESIYLSTDDIYDYYQVTAIGWGQTSQHIGGFSNILQKVNLVTLPNKKCGNFHDQLNETMLCVGGSKEGICKGDIGGPLIYYVNGHHPVIVGIASFLGRNGCEIDPAVFTRVHPYNDWIRNQTGLDKI